MKFGVSSLGIALAMAGLSCGEAKAFSPDMQMTGAGVVQACTIADMNWVSFCNGYMQAAVDSLREGDGICFPLGTTRTDLVTVAEREISASAALQALNGLEATKRALRKVYPC